MLAHSPLIMDPVQTPPGPPNFQLPWCSIFLQPYGGVVEIDVKVDVDVLEVLVVELDVDEGEADVLSGLIESTMEGGL